MSFFSPLFSPHPEDCTPELGEVGAWIRAEVARAAEAKNLGVREWALQYGKRDSGGRGGVPSLAQWGFQVVGVDGDGQPLPLEVFIDEAIALDDRDLARRIIDLWTDRVETGGVP